jgi:hypothetical protein
VGSGWRRKGAYSGPALSTNMTDTEDTPAVRPLVGGRPKGSKNQITVLKLLMEETVRSKNQERIAQVLDDIITDALAGDRDCRKLVWQSVMSKSGNDSAPNAGTQPTIIIRTDRDAPVRRVDVLEGEITPIEDSNG